MSFARRRGRTARDRGDGAQQRGDRRRRATRPSPRPSSCSAATRHRVPQRPAHVLERRTRRRPAACSANCAMDEEDGRAAARRALAEPRARLPARGARARPVRLTCSRSSVRGPAALARRGRRVRAGHHRRLVRGRGAARSSASATRRAGGTAVRSRATDDGRAALHAGRSLCRAHALRPHVCRRPRRRRARGRRGRRPNGQGSAGRRSLARAPPLEDFGGEWSSSRGKQCTPGDERCVERARPSARRRPPPPRATVARAMLGDARPAQHLVNAGESEPQRALALVAAARRSACGRRAASVIIVADREPGELAAFVDLTRPLFRDTASGRELLRRQRRRGDGRATTAGRRLLLRARFRRPPTAANPRRESAPRPPKTGGTAMRDRRAIRRRSARGARPDLLVACHEAAVHDVHARHARRGQPRARGRRAKRHRVDAEGASSSRSAPPRRRAPRDAEVGGRRATPVTCSARSRTTTRASSRRSATPQRCPRRPTSWRCSARVSWRSSASQRSAPICGRRSRLAPRATSSRRTSCGTARSSTRARRPLARARAAARIVVSRSAAARRAIAAPARVCGDAAPATRSRARRARARAREPFRTSVRRRRAGAGGRRRHGRARALVPMAARARRKAPPQRRSAARAATRADRPQRRRRSARRRRSSTRFARATSVTSRSTSAALARFDAQVAEMAKPSPRASSTHVEGLMEPAIYVLRPCQRASVVATRRADRRLDVRDPGFVIARTPRARGVARKRGRPRRGPLRMRIAIGGSADARPSTARQRRRRRDSPARRSVRHRGQRRSRTSHCRTHAE